MKKLKKARQVKPAPKVKSNGSPKVIPSTPKEWEAHYNEVASFYESDESLDLMSRGVPVSTSKLREISKQPAKLISIRMPALDLAGIKRIAEKNSQPYQRVIIHAVERYIDEEEKKDLRQTQEPRQKKII